MSGFKVLDELPPTSSPRTESGGYVVLDTLPSQDAAKSRARPGLVEDAVKSIPGAIPRAAAGLADLATIPLRAVPAINNAIAARVYGQAPAQSVPEPPSGPILRGVDRAYDAVTGGEGGIYKPQRASGRIADLATQVAVTGGGASPRALTQGLAMGVGAGGAQELARTVTSNPLVLAASGFAGGVAGAAPFMLRGVPAANINHALKNVSDDQLQQAQALMDDAAAIGSPITGAEAIAKVSGKNAMSDIQRVVEQSQRGGPVMQPMMNARPEANRNAFASAADASVGRMPALPERIPAKLEGAAASAIDAVRKAGNAAAKPDYDAARTQRIPPPAWDSVMADPAVAEAVKKVRSNPEWRVTAEPDGSVALLDAAKRWIDDKLKKPDIGPAKASLWREARENIVGTVDPLVPAYASARQTVAQHRRANLQPMVESPVGDLAKTRGAPVPAEDLLQRQGGVLMPAAPGVTTPEAIRTAVQTLNKQDPDAAKEFVRANLERIFNEAAQNNMPGANQWGGAKFASGVAGNKAQEANLAELVEAAGGKGAYDGFRRFLDVMEAQGTRHAAGSMTEFNRQTAGALSAGGAGSVPAAAMSPGRATTAVYDWYQRFRYGKNTEEMARILTDPESVMLMKELAKTKPDSAIARAIVGQIVTQNAPVSESPNR